jgi:DNA-binding response OmpR family regulator
MPETKHILIVEDRVSVRTMMADYLKSSFTVSVADNGLEALRIIEQQTFDCVLLDLMMPIMDGIEFLTLLRTKSNVPVLVISAKIDENDIVTALDLGADEYITKPVSMRSVAARIHAIMRRSGHSTGLDNSPHFMLNAQSRSVVINQREIMLTNIEFKILELLYTRANTVLSRQEISDVIYGVDRPNMSRSIDVHIRNLRLKIEPDPNEPTYITTVYGNGYRCKISTH